MGSIIKNVKFMKYFIVEDSLDEKVVGRFPSSL
jgi:hypothetical protein